jgi:NAD-dependent dihydropyrimidine dehydrogenase PreA subunit
VCIFCKPAELIFRLSQSEQGGDQQMWEVTVDKDKCDGDEECVDVCPVDVFEMVDGKADPVNAEECLGCESCVEVCEAEAITVEEV